MLVDLLVGKPPLARDALDAGLDKQAFEYPVDLYELRLLCLAAWTLGTVG